MNIKKLILSALLALSLAAQAPAAKQLIKDADVSGTFTITGTGSLVAAAGSDVDISLGSVTLGTLAPGSLSFQDDALRIYDQDGSHYLTLGIGSAGNLSANKTLNLDVSAYTASRTLVLPDINLTFTAGGAALVNSAGTADTFPYFSGINTVTLGSITAFGRSLADDNNAAAAITTLELDNDSKSLAISSVRVAQIMDPFINTVWDTSTGLINYTSSPMIDLQNGYLLNPGAGFPSVKWKDYQLVDFFGTTVLDWNGYTFYGPWTFNDRVQGNGFNPVSAVAAGTAYTMTASSAAVDFGTTDPAITLSGAGIWVITAVIQTSYNGATYAAPQAATITLRRTNNTAADIVALSEPLDVVTTLTQAGPTAQIVQWVYTTANSDDALTIYANLSATPSAGSVQVTKAWITATPQGD